MGPRLLLTGRQGFSKLPVKSRPNEIAWWFKHGRRRLSTPKDLPHIESVQEFENEWVQWWSEIQPEWRDTKDWPFAQEDAVGRCWGHLPKGGKYGLFLIVISLGWWIDVRDPLEASKVDAAVADVSWVLKNLVTVLIGSVADSDSDTDDPAADDPAIDDPATDDPTTDSDSSTDSSSQPPTPTPRRKRS